MPLAVPITVEWIQTTARYGSPVVGRGRLVAAMLRGGAGTLSCCRPVVVLLAIGAARAAVVCLLLAAVLALCYVAVGVRAPPGRGILTSAARGAPLAVTRSAGATGAK